MWSDIEREWLPDGGRLEVPPTDVERAFDNVERHLGREWIDGRRRGVNDTPLWGAMPTLSVVTMGQRLAAVEACSGFDRLLQRLRAAEPAAQAELTAMYLLRSRRPRAEIEIAPSVTVRGTNRIPDFRTRLGESAWTYVEIAQPDDSDAKKRVTEVLERLSTRIVAVKKRFALEVYLRREPTDEEVTAIEALALDFCQLEGLRQQGLGDVGLLRLNHCEPGTVVVDTPAGEESVPRLGQVRMAGGTTEPTRHVAVRIAFSDQRAEQLMTKESRQLPTDFPGLLMFGHQDFKTWEPLLTRRLQPTIHTRVGGVCMWGAGYRGTPEGTTVWIPVTRVLVNPHAALALPDWVVATLREHEKPEQADRFAK